MPFAAVLAGLLALLAAPRLMSGGPYTAVLGIGLFLLCYGVWRVALAARYGGQLLPAQMVDLILRDPAPCLVTGPSGQITLHNAAASALFSATNLGQKGARAPLQLSSCLSPFVASPSHLVARLAARALAQGSVSEDVQSQGQMLHITALPVAKGRAILWRLDFSAAQGKHSGADGIGLPMLTANKTGVVLFSNSALRKVLGRRPKTLADIAGDKAWRSGEEITLQGADGPVAVMMVELPSPAQRREIYLLPLPEPSGDPQAAGTNFEGIPVALMMLSPDGMVRFANAAARDILGPQSQTGTFFHEIFDALGRPAADWLADVVEERLPMGSQVVRLNKNPAEGQNFVQVTLRRMVHNARPSILAVLQDANALKTLEAQFVQSQKMQAIGQLAGGVAHDFNNLLTAISGNTDLLLLRHAGDDPSYPDLMQIRQNANRAAALVAQLLAFSRKQNLQPEYLDMQDVFSDLTHLLNRLVGEKLRLVLNHGGGIGTIRADRRQLEQVIMNLVVNARDAMPKGGSITLTTQALNLTEDLHRDRAVVPAGEYVQILIADTGTGIPLEIRSKIFEPFFTTKKAGEGTGLGLSTAYGIVKQSGGFIFVDSVMGEGTTFTLYFPIHNRPAGEAPIIAKAGVIRQGEGIILLVEDEAPVRAFASRALRLRGYSVLEAATGEEALAILHDSALAVDLFVSDVIMPGLDGPTWVREAQLTRPDVPVIFVSGYSEDVMTEQQARIANSTFLPKPFSLAELTLAVQQKLPQDSPN